MTKVFCGADECRYNEDGVCTRGEIHLGDYGVWHACKEAHLTEKGIEKHWGRK